MDGLLEFKRFDTLLHIPAYAKIVIKPLSSPHTDIYILKTCSCLLDNFSNTRVFMARCLSMCEKNRTRQLSLSTPRAELDLFISPIWDRNKRERRKNSIHRFRTTLLETKPVQGCVDPVFETVHRVHRVQKKKRTQRLHTLT